MACIDNEYRKTLLFQAKLAEQAKRYDEMSDAMKKLTILGVNLTPEERNLLTQSFKKSIKPRRSFWTKLSSIENQKSELINNYREIIEFELTGICNDVVKLVDDHLIPSSLDSNDAESAVFYYKMKGDYYRYLAEINTDEVRERAANESLAAYEEATAMAEAKLAKIHPIRLGLALNLSVLHYEILNSPENSREIAEEAYDEAITELFGLDRENAWYDDTTAILRLLGNNLVLWKYLEEVPSLNDYYY